MENNTGQVWAIWYEKTPDTPQATFPSKLYRYIPDAGYVCKRMTKSFNTPEQAHQWIREHPKENFFNAHVKDERPETLQALQEKRKEAAGENPYRKRPRPFHIYR